MTPGQLESISGERGRRDIPSPRFWFVTISSPFPSTLASSLGCSIARCHPNGARYLTSASSRLSSKQSPKPVYCGVFDDASTLQLHSVSMSDTPAGNAQTRAETAIFSHFGGIDVEAMRNAEIELFDPTIITEGPHLPFYVSFGSGDTREVCNRCPPEARSRTSSSLLEFRNSGRSIWVIPRHLGLRRVDKVGSYSAREMPSCWGNSNWQQLSEVEEVEHRD